MLFAVIIGYIASFFIVVAYLPQVYKTLKIKEARDFSIYYLLTIMTGLALYVVYGFLIISYPLILQGGISFALTTPILYYNIKGKNKQIIVSNKKL